MGADLYRACYLTEFEHHLVVVLATRLTDNGHDLGCARGCWLIVIYTPGAGELALRRRSYSVAR